jgi:ElaB/YqjD/DUF883 family membrane-anchored ribosome-binding protein
MEDKVKDAAARVDRVLEDKGIEGPGNRGKVSEFVDEARHKGGQVFETVKEKVAAGTRTLRTKSFDDLMEDSRDFVRTHPGRVVLFSLAAGVILGLMMRGGRDSD